MALFNVGNSALAQALNVGAQRQQQFRAQISEEQADALRRRIEAEQRAKQEQMQREQEQSGIFGTILGALPRAAIRFFTR